MEFSAIVEIDSKDTLVYACTAINRHIHLCLNTTVKIVSSTFHQISSYGRVMCNLLEIHRTPIDPALIGLSQNWIKRFFHSHVNE